MKRIKKTLFVITVLLGLGVIAFAGYSMYRTITNWGSWNTECTICEVCEEIEEETEIGGE